MRTKALRAGAFAFLAPFALAFMVSAEGVGGGLSLSGVAKGWFTQWEDRGSVFVPRGAGPSFSGGAAVDLRAEAGGLSRCLFDGQLTIDAVSGKPVFLTRELWVEWRPAEAVAFRLGRMHVGFGSGFGFNPANDLDPPRYSSDPASPSVGIDAARLRLVVPVGSDLPLECTLIGILPGETGRSELSLSTVAALVYALIGDLEIMLVGDFADPGGDKERWLVGAWTQLPLGSLVLGLEAALRKRPDLFRPGSGGLPVADLSPTSAAVATTTLRMGDFLAVAEVSWNGWAYTRPEFEAILGSPYAPAFSGSLFAPNSVGNYHGLCRLTWASGDWTASLSGVGDLESGAFLATLDFEVALQAETGLRVSLSMPAPVTLLERDELGLSGRGWAGLALLSVHF